MAAKLTRLAHKIAIQLHLVAESCSAFIPTVHEFPVSIRMKCFRSSLKPFLHYFFHDWCSFQMQCHQCWFFGCPGSSSTLVHSPLNVFIHPYKVCSGTCSCCHSSVRFTSSPVFTPQIAFSCSLIPSMKGSAVLNVSQYNHSENQLRVNGGRFLLFISAMFLCRER
jgi:hypothetical protein